MTENYHALLARMSGDLALLTGHLDKIVRTAPLRYKKYLIKKRNGGDRLVAQPAREVKSVQYWLISNVLSDLPIHHAAMAYRAGISIKDNASLHVDSNFLLKVDFRSFFPSIKKVHIKGHLAHHLGTKLSADSIEMVAHSLSWAPSRGSSLELCIGAPSSPLISNSILFEFDKILDDYACTNDLAYSRYADDITISSKTRGQLDAALDFIALTIMNLPYPRLELNSHKTVFASRRSRRSVTGLVLTPNYNISLGRERKRLIASMYHHYITGKLPLDELPRLKGLLAFAESVEPGFHARLINKHSVQTPGT